MAKNCHIKTSEIPETIPKNARAFLFELMNEYNQFSWQFGNRFKFRAPKTITIDQNGTYPHQYFALLTLHELGHALSNHKDYNIDVERLKAESEAWQHAKTLIKTHEKWQKDYKISWDEDFAENELDSYRDWLHKKSKCKNCGLTMFQTDDKKYHCPNCDCL